MTKRPGPEIQNSKARSPYPWMLFGICLVLLLLPLPHPPRSGWIPLVWNWSHFPLFTILACTLMRQLARHGRTPALAMTMLAMVMIAAGSELLQTWTARSPEWKDFLLDLVGATAGICLGLALNREPPGGTMPWFVFAGALLLSSTLPLLAHARALFLKHSILPSLEDFEPAHTAELWFLERNGRLEDLALTPTPNAPSGHELKISLSPPGLVSLHYNVPTQDWSPYRSLAFDCRLESDHAIELGIRIDSSDGAPRLRLAALLEPGAHHVTVPLRTLQSSSPSPLLKVDQLVLFFENPGSIGDLFLDNLRLE